MFAGSAGANVKVWGQLNRMVSFTGDGHQNNALFLDNDFAPSQLGLTANYMIDKCSAVGGIVDLTTSPNNSRLTSQVRNADQYYNMVTVRRADLWLTYGQLGRLSLGYGDAASYGITRLSFAGTGETVSSAQVSNLAGGMIFHPSNGAASGLPAVQAPLPGGNPTVSTVFNSLDGVGSIFDETDLYRSKNRVRWDSCEWCGFMVSVSYGNVQPYYQPGVGRVTSNNLRTTRNYTDVAARYEGSFCDFDFEIGAAWARFQRDYYNAGQTALVQVANGAAGPGGDTWTGTGVTTRHSTLWAGSVAVEHKCTGLNAAAAYGNYHKMVPSFSNASTWFVQIGKHNCFCSYGQTDIAVDFTQGKNMAVNSDKGNSWGVGIVQNVDKANSQFYATYRYYKYKLPSVATLTSNGQAGVFAANAYDAINVVSLGVLFKFGAML
jgi:hypothetical protein